MGQDDDSLLFGLSDYVPVYFDIRQRGTGYRDFNNVLGSGLARIGTSKCLSNIGRELFRLAEAFAREFKFQG